MDVSTIILEYLKVFISWPVATVIILLGLKNEVAQLLKTLPKRLKSAEIGGQKIEFYEDLEKESKVTAALENIQKDNPDMVEKSLKSVGLQMKEYDQYKNDVRSRISKIQHKLVEKGYDIGQYGADGMLGIGTKTAIKKFQKDHGLIVDGIVGYQTWNYLFEE